MKRFIFLTFLSLLAVTASADILFSMASAKGKPAQALELPVNLANNEAFAGFELRIYLPEGISFKGTARKDRVKAADRLDGFTITGADQADGSYKISVANFDGDPIEAGNGPLFSLLLNIDDNAALGACEIKLANIRYSKDEVLYNASDAVCAFKVYQLYTVTAQSANETQGTVAGGGEVESDTEVTLTATPATGYDFAGWMSGETRVSTDAAYTFTPTASQTLTATFAPHVYKATFVSEGKQEVLDIAYGDAVTPPTAADKKGHTFAGWDNVPETMPAEDITVTAQYTVNTYKVTYKVDGTKYKSYSVDYGAPVPVVDDPVKEGYTFSGWSTIPATMPAKNVTVTGTFTVNQYKVSFVIGEQIIDEQTLDYGTAITAPEAPTVVGYTFAGWGEVDATVPARDVTYTGTYTVNTYKVTYKVDNDDYKTIEVNYGGVIPVENAPTKEGYTFSGWSEIPATMPAQDVTVTGSFTVNQYKVSFVIGEQVIDEKTLDYGTAITAPEAPTVEGYTFAGWGEVDATVPARDVTYTGSYTVNTYTVTYMLGDVVVGTETVAFGATIPLPESLDNERYELLSWEDVPETMPAHDVTLYALYTDGIQSARLRSLDNETIYGVDGKRKSTYHRGLNIVRTQDGRVRKLMVK